METCPCCGSSDIKEISTKDECTRGDGTKVVVPCLYIKCNVCHEEIAHDDNDCVFQELLLKKEF